MFHDRIKVAEKNWGKPMNIFWEAREEFLPKHLRLECNAKDYGVSPNKQNHYLKTGQVIMMDREHTCFGNDYNDYVGW
jgi:hypothetical protein